jgi:murein DD-endopeptidase MepM/ murein hydrolase activator NlpD
MKNTECSTLFHRCFFKGLFIGNGQERRVNLKKTLLLIVVMLFTFHLFQPINIHAEDDVYEKRMDLYKKAETITHIPWYFIAAIDQYERNVRNTRKSLPDTEGVTGVYFTERDWVGPINPNLDDQNPISIKLFGGFGTDGDGDGNADRTNDDDALFAMAEYISSYGFDEDNIKIGLWDYYKRDKTVSMIIGFSKLYKKYGLKLEDHSFPVPLNRNYSYRSTWGDRRGWGGLRIHEGTDIFADYGVPVRSTGYGVVELVGWNRYGGWRIGIRDINNIYHYYGHLKGYEGEFKTGQLVEPGQVIGYVGSSGYGPPGTQGKFPPHLHYGMYKDNGISEWSFDPYPHLRAWERKERRK